MSRLSIRRRILVAVATVGLLTGVAACGSGDDSGDSKKVTVAVGPFLGFALPWYAQEKGYFKAEGLDVELKSVSGGASVMIPLTSSGDVTFGAAGGADVLPAIVGGAKLSFIADVGSPLSNDMSTSPNLILAKDPAIKRPRDLEGKDVALLTLGGAQEAFARVAIREDGGDDTKVNFVKLPLQNIPEAISSGKVDAGQALEPFLTAGTDMGLRGIIPLGGALAGAPELAYFVDSRWAKENPDSVDAFVRAMKKAEADVNADPDLLRASLAKNADMDPKVTAKLRPMKFAESMPTSEFDRLAKFLNKQGLLGEPTPASDWVVTAGS